jgi:hypothetical protein
MQGNLEENILVIDCMEPDAVAASTILSPAIDTQGLDEIMFIVRVGTLGTSATLAAKVTECATSGGTYTDITGAAITTITQASPDGSDQNAVISVKIDANRLRYFKLSMTVATATSDAGAIAIGKRSSGTKPEVQTGTISNVAETVRV